MDHAVASAASIGAQSFGLFLCNQRTWYVKPFDERTIPKFQKALENYGFPPHLILPHASYLMNCGSGDPVTLSKSRELLIDGLSRCDRLGIQLYNFHPVRMSSWVTDRVTNVCGRARLLARFR